MKKKLLIPLDGSEFSKTILEHVIQLFKPDEAEIFLLRVTEVPKEEHESFTRMMGGWGVLIDWAPLVSQELRSELDDKQAEHITYFEKELSDELIDSLRSAKATLSFAGFDTFVDIRFGHEAEQIRAFVDQKAIDLIAMATHGRTGLAKAVMGSVATQLLQDCHLPILMYRPAPKLAGETLPHIETVNAVAGD